MSGLADEPSMGHESSNSMDVFDELVEKAMSLNLIDDGGYDLITDAIAEDRVALDRATDEVRRAIDEFEAGGDPPDLGTNQLWQSNTVVEQDSPDSPLTPLCSSPNTIAIVLDTHYLEVAVKAFSVASGWSVGAFESALVSACGGGKVVSRHACDSSQANKPLHAALREAGYSLVLSPPKPSNGMQGATDVDVACCIFTVAGAFANEPLADTLALVAGDSDFRPALAAALASGRELQVAVVAEGAQVRSHTGHAVDATPLLGCPDDELTFKRARLTCPPARAS